MSNHEFRTTSYNWTYEFIYFLDTRVEGVYALWPVPQKNKTS